MYVTGINTKWYNDTMKKDVNHGMKCLNKNMNKETEFA